MFVDKVKFCSDILCLFREQTNITLERHVSNVKNEKLAIDVTAYNVNSPPF